MKAMGGNLRNGILNISILEVNELYSCFMPFVEGGGLFLRTNKEYNLGEEVFVLLDLMDEPDKIPLTGKIIWVTPIGSGPRPQGVGIQFSDENVDLFRKIETSLAGLLDSNRPTYTM